MGAGKNLGESTDKVALARVRSKEKMGKKELGTEKMEMMGESRSWGRSWE